jgi:hypothetical protein
LSDEEKTPLDRRVRCPSIAAEKKYHRQLVAVVELENPRVRMSSFYVAAKKLFVSASPRPSYVLESFSQFLKLGEYVRTSGLKETPWFPHKFAMYEYIQRTVIGPEPIDFLEFGVFMGTSLGRWTEINKNERSRFFGFDTFEGLPEPWKQVTGTVPAGHFSTKGETPPVTDGRVQFIKGLFQSTLESFVRRSPPINRLVIHVDADTYSAALFVLSVLHPYMKRGTLVIFDEFGSVNCEFRAFCDYSASFYKSFRPIGHAGHFYDQVTMQVD